MQAWVEDINDDPEALSFDSTTTTTATCVEMELRSWSDTAAMTASRTPSSSTKPHAPSSDPCWDLIQRALTESTALCLNDLRLLRRLGSGDIGSVYLVELKQIRGCVFAAKVMDKEELMSRNKESRARAEKEILEILDHPFLPTLYTTLESSRWSILLTEFCPGGDLHVLRQRLPARRLDEAAVRFYASEVLVALEYLHLMGIIYRDLKPENVLVRSDGHIMLIDFDLSLKCEYTASMAQLVPSQRQSTTRKSDEILGVDPRGFSTSACILPNCILPAVRCFHYKLARRRRRTNRRGALEIVAEPIDARSMSFVGTHEYLAPEIVSGEGHGNAVDWWTLGIFIFELSYGVTPFKGSDNECTLANIVGRALEFPKDPPIASPAKDLISRLLIKDPLKRMGSTMGATSIKHHPFFDGVNWALLRCTPPPFIPPGIIYRNHVTSEDDSVEYY